MSQDAYQLLFYGQVVAGFNRELVKENFAELTHLPMAKVESIFLSSHTVLKKFNSITDAQLYQVRLIAMGLEVEVVEVFAQSDSGAIPTQKPTLRLQPIEESSRLPETYFSLNQQHVNVRRLPIVIVGKSRAYWSLWWVNALLSLVTLGFYSPWARVRNRRYIYQHTRLNQLAFDYRVSPFRLLQRRLLAVIAVAAYGLCLVYWEIAARAIEAVFFLIWPWLLASRLNFHMHGTCFNGLRFGFTSSWWRIWLVMNGWLLASIISCGLLLPLAVQQITKFSINCSRYGNDYFAFDAPVLLYYRTILIAVLQLMISIGIAVGIYLFEPWAGLVAIILGILLVYCYLRISLSVLLFDHTQLGEHRFYLSLAWTDYLREQVVNLVWMTLTLGLYYPLAQLRIWRLRAAHWQMIAAGSVHYYVEQQRSEIKQQGKVAELCIVD